MYTKFKAFHSLDSQRYPLAFHGYICSTDIPTFKGGFNNSFVQRTCQLLMEIPRISLFNGHTNFKSRFQGYLCSTGMLTFKVGFKVIFVQRTCQLNT